ncbi:MAG: peptidoglycan bridge formation glycyltransferase FemA/FemB family protein [Patescibacteria group bacterium]|nr:peptidoglycan bridge formation glycyltransferase FemA/FemB family protein [Patescibacteria group bacterium]
MQIIEITDKKQLNDFVGAQPMSQFLQSWQWGEFQKVVSGQVRRVGVVDDNGRLVGSAKVITKELPIGRKYFYCARGPIIAADADKKEIMKLLFGKIKELAEDEGIMFLRFDPLHQSDYQSRTVKTIDVQPSKTLLLDLVKSSEDELLRAMHPKTRYNISLAVKRGVKIITGDKNKFEEFWRLLDQTSDRDKFRPHGRSYYQTMIELGDSPIKLFFAEYKGKLLATALVSYFGDTATYLHGGSADEDRNVMAPYLLQWQAIKLAKAGGQKYYDFHGINEAKWPGVTRFKKGFGGFELNYPGTFDMVYDQSWYQIYKMVRKVRRTF